MKKISELYTEQEIIGIKFNRMLKKFKEKYKTGPIRAFIQIKDGDEWVCYCCDKDGWTYFNYANPYSANVGYEAQIIDEVK